jgi:hypothetical protein
MARVRLATARHYTGSVPHGHSAHRNRTVQGSVDTAQNPGQRRGNHHSHAGLEVDFVVYGPNLFQAIEVKRSARVTSAELKGLKAFRADYLEAQCLLLSFCPEPLLIDGIRCEPLEGWLRELRL